MKRGRFFMLLCALALAPASLALGESPADVLATLRVPDGFTVELVAAAPLVAHPIIADARDKNGKLTAEPQEAKDRDVGTRESFIHIHVERIADAARRAEIGQSLEQVLAQVRLAVQDWRPMVARLAGIIKELKSNPPPVPVDDIAEAIQFLEWLADDNFTLLGVRDHAFDRRRLQKPVADRCDVFADAR